MSLPTDLHIFDFLDLPGVTEEELEEAGIQAKADMEEELYEGAEPKGDPQDNRKGIE